MSKVTQITKVKEKVSFMKVTPSCQIKIKQVKAPYRIRGDKFQAKVTEVKQLSQPTDLTILMTTNK